MLNSSPSMLLADDRRSFSRTRTSVPSGMRRAPLAATMLATGAGARAGVAAGGAACEAGGGTYKADADDPGAILNCPAAPAAIGQAMTAVTQSNETPRLSRDLPNIITSPPKAATIG
jgi:hypothetical protein